MANKFADELKIFQEEEAAAQQYFYAYLTVAEMAERDSELLQLIHLHPWFWFSVHHAMLVATFVTLGRIFDPTGSPHRIDKLMKALATNLGEFSADALKARLIEKGRSPEEATQHVARVLDWDSENPATIPLAAALIDENLKPRAHAQVRELKKKVERWRTAYKASWADIRKKVTMERYRPILTKRAK
ncbi:MAG: hypothetical protein ACLQU2_23270 [Candidatus Binataceae bacterium]